MPSSYVSNRPLIAIGAFSAVAIGFLFWLIYGFDGMQSSRDWSFLPAFNAACNAISASFVTAGILLIRNGRQREHGVCMLCAMAASALFLCGYILHHSLHGDTRFLTTGWIRPVYFFILITHVVLSIAVLPMVLSTVFFALRKQWPAHRKLAKWTYPVWLYVSITGVLVFFFLRVLNVASA
jgi:putative membrane protein